MCVYSLCRRLGLPHNPVETAAQPSVFQQAMLAASSVVPTFCTFLPLARKELLFNFDATIRFHILHKLPAATKVVSVAHRASLCVNLLHFGRLMCCIEGIFRIRICRLQQLDMIPRSTKSCYQMGSGSIVLPSSFRHFDSLTISQREIHFEFQFSDMKSLFVCD